MNDVKTTVKAYILEKHLPGESPDNLRDDTPLQTSGILDSFAVLGLVTFVEQQYSVQLSATETGIELFDSLDNIAQLVARKQQVAAV
jgi:acyl carrier protein